MANEGFEYRALTSASAIKQDALNRRNNTQSEASMTQMSSSGLSDQPNMRHASRQPDARWNSCGSS